MVLLSRPKEDNGFLELKVGLNCGSVRITCVSGPSSPSLCLGQCIVLSVYLCARQGLCGLREGCNEQIKGCSLHYAIFYKNKSLIS